MADKDILNLDLQEGMLVQAKDGWRGKITEINWKANKWPYSVENARGQVEIYAAHELTAVDQTPILRGEVVDSVAFLDVEIAELEKKVRKLKLARSVLERVEV